MRIRTANLDDVRGLVPLIRAFYAEEGCFWPADRGEPALRHLLKHPEIGFVMLAGDDQPLGYAVVTFNYDLEFGGRDAFVTEIFVQSQHRGKGLGKKLLQEIEATAHDRDVLALHLQVRPENATARTLYKAAGYLPVPRLTLTKPLTPR